MTNKIGISRATSYAIVELPIFLDNRVDTHCLAVFVALCSFANAERVAFPSYETIAKRAKCGRRTVVDKIKKLESLGYLKKINTYKENSKENGVNHYVILNPALKESYPQSAGDALGGAGGALGGAGGCIEVVQEMHCNNTNITIPNNNIYTSASANKKIKVPINHKKGDK